MERFNLSDLQLITKEEDLLGNFTSVKGEYNVPGIEKTGFYKENGCILGAKNEEDLREFLSSKILDKIGLPHADIILAKDEQGNNGCLSMNILKKNEHFAEPQELSNSATNIDEFINRDLAQISTIPEITSEDLKNRKEYLLKYIFASALISNTDMKMDNMFLVKNDVTGKFRNPEYYDMGVAFIEDRKFFNKISSNEIIEELYESYPTQVVSFGKQIQKNLQNSDIEVLLQDESLKDFSEESRNSIKNQLFDRVNLITKLNEKEKNQFKIRTDKLHEVSKDSDLSLRDRVSNYLLKAKEKILGRNRDD